MVFFKRSIDFFTLGSPRPVRRLVAYYAALWSLAALLFYLFPTIDPQFTTANAARTEAIRIAGAPSLLQDGLITGDTIAVAPAPVAAPNKKTARLASPVGTRLHYAISTTLLFLSTLALMLPVSWVYMSARPGKTHDQAIAQTLLILPLVVAGVVLTVRDSLALAFSLGGVVAAVRFRTTLSDARDIVFIFLAIGVGFSAGVQVITVAALLSMTFNFVLIALWRYDFGRNVLEATGAPKWAEPLSDLTTQKDGVDNVPDRALILSLTPLKVEALETRFHRLRDRIGHNPKKPRYNAVVTLTTNTLSEAEEKVEEALEASTKRWRLDEVVTNDGKPSELYYLVSTRKSINRDALLTAIHVAASEFILSAKVEIGNALAIENGEVRAQRKLDEAS